ncbi:MAG: zf-HC2 domain-containing protein [Gemmatimonadaceae bacterium]
MNDCSNAEIRDLLPDYVHDQLSVTDLARVQQHVVSCADCAEELELLQMVFALRPVVKAPNFADILARLPKPGQQTSFTIAASDARSDNAGRDIAVRDIAVRDIASARSVARKSPLLRNWRAAAAIAVVTLGGLSVAISRDRVFGRAGAGSLSDTTELGVALINEAPAPLFGIKDSAKLVNDSKVSLSVGDLSDYSDDELKAIMAGLDQWDGSASTDPLPGVPILPPGS